MANKKPNPNHNMVNVKSKSEQQINDHKLASKTASEEGCEVALFSDFIRQGMDRGPLTGAVL